MADQVRLERAIGPYHADLDVVRGLPTQLRQDRFRGTVVTAEQHRLGADLVPRGSEPVPIEPGWTLALLTAAAVDVGRIVQAPEHRQVGQDPGHQAGAFDGEHLCFNGHLPTAFAKQLARQPGFLHQQLKRIVTIRRGSGVWGVRRC